MMTTSARTGDALRLPPHRRAVPTRTRVRTRRIPLAAYALILLALPVAVLLGARASGWWVTDGHTVPSTALGAELVNTPAHSSPRNGPSAATTALNPRDIKGSMTVQQVIDALPGISAIDIYQRFGAPADTPTGTQLKTLAQNGNGYEVTDLREWLEERVSDAP